MLLQGNVQTGQPFNITSNPVASYVVSGSAVTSVQFTGLDLNTDKDWVLICKVKNATSSSGKIFGYVNGDTTNGNYRYINHWVSSDSHDKEVGDGPTISELQPSLYTYSAVNISIVNGYVMMSSITIKMDSGNAIVLNLGCIKETSETNVAQLDITSAVANSLGIGSEFRLYRRG